MGLQDGQGQQDLDNWKVMVPLEQSKAIFYSMQEQVIDKLVKLQALAHAMATITNAIKVESFVIVIVSIVFVVFPFL